MHLHPEPHSGAIFEARETAQIANAQHGQIVRSRNIAMLKAALQNVHRPSVAQAIVDVFGTVAARQIARDLDRVAGGGK